MMGCALTAACMECRLGKCVLAVLARGAYGLTADLVHFQIKPAMQNDRRCASPLSGIGRVFFKARFVDFLGDFF